MSKTHVKIIFFNVNGLRKESKRSVILNKLKQFDSMVYLQETHFTKNDEKAWEDKWVVKILFSYSTSNNTGLAILIPSNIDFEFYEK